MLPAIVYLILPLSLDTTYSFSCEEEVEALALKIAVAGFVRSLGLESTIFHSN